MNSLGKNGRFGNSMFQYAAIVGISKNCGFDYIIPDHSGGYDWEGRNHHQLQHCFNMTNLGNRFGYIDGDTVELNQYHFCKELFDECPDNITLHGHFESYKYFQNVEQELRLDFTFKDFILESCNRFYEKNNIKNAISIIIRRGDFLNFQDCHPVCNIEYYKKCISKFNSDRQFVIISDDIDWCKSQELFFGNNFFFVNMNEFNVPKAHYDMCISSFCDDFIISNSTFAWWCSWLSKNKNKKVYSPVPWFGNNYSNWNTDDLYPNYFIKIFRNI